MKAKTRKSIQKRFKLSAGGKLMHRVAFGRHLRRHKSQRQKRRYGKTAVLEGRMANKITKIIKNTL
jgi:large subunit ribosomal protein L35